MAIGKISGFNIYAPELTDNLRGSFVDLAARDALNLAYRKEGLVTYVESTQTLYVLMGGIANSNWVAFASAAGIPREKVTTNNNSFVGIEIGLNVFPHTKGTKDIIVQFKDANGNVLNLTPTISDTTVSIVSGVTYVGAELIIL